MQSYTNKILTFLCGNYSFVRLKYWLYAEILYAQKICANQWPKNVYVKHVCESLMPTAKRHLPQPYGHCMFQMECSNEIYMEYNMQFLNLQMHVYLAINCYKYADINVFFHWLYWYDDVSSFLIHAHNV